MIEIRPKYILYLFLGGLAPTLFFILGDLIQGKIVYSIETLISWLIGSVFSCTYTVIIGTVVTLCWSIINEKVPFEKGLMRRYFTQLLFSNIVAVSTMVLLCWITLQLGFVDIDEIGVAEREIYSSNIQITIVMNSMCITISELYFYFKQWKGSLIERERLEKENIQSQFQSLKNQVNPHFLFNSLNTLSALIHKDPDQAEEFIDEFAKVYRYILEFDDKHLVTIEEELSFIQSYIFLQKIRFGENLRVKIDVGEGYLEEHVPPLSMQILVENAIKHNVISKEHPLFICITTENNNLVVKNNLQLRLEDQKSTGIGLKNITRRYELFAGKTPDFSHTENAFLATIPILKNEIAAINESTGN